MLADPVCSLCNNGAQELPCIRCALAPFRDAVGVRPTVWLEVEATLARDPKLRIALLGPEQSYLLHSVEEPGQQLRFVLDALPEVERPKSLVVLDELDTFTRTTPRLRLPEERGLARFVPIRDQLTVPEVRRAERVLRPDLFGVLVDEIKLAEVVPIEPPPFPKSRRSFKRNARKLKRGRR